MRLILFFFLLSFCLTGFAAHQEHKDDRICAPFRDGIVDPVIVNSMLEAAKNGHLYRIKPKQSRVGFCVRSALGYQEAEFKDVIGGIALRREVWGDKSQVLVMVDTDSLAMRDDFIKDMLKSDIFLDTENYSKILFVSSELDWLDREHAELKGILTMHGIKRPIVFNVTIAVKPDEMTEGEAEVIVTASSFLNRADFNMGNLSFLVDNKVELCMQIRAGLFRNIQH
jgi:polyisoprenoid-binding protein YceI